MKRIAIPIIALLTAALVAGGFTVRRALTAPKPDAEPIVFDVPAGATLGRVAASLEQAGLIRRAWAFEGLARWQGKGGSLRAGEYEFSAMQSPAEILDRLARGQVLTHPFSFPEGLTAAEIAVRFEEAGLAEAEEILALVHDTALVAELSVEGDDLEGYLFPETYRWARGVGARAMIEDLVEQFRLAWAPLASLAKARELSMHEVVVLASIVEKETGAPEERPRIAAVFLNRLRRGMRLETDPAVIYGIPDFDGNLRRVHLEDTSNAYNTYKIPGLPPGPIANPGAAALRAVVEPSEQEDAIFFVSKNDGTHHFSRTYAEHARAVDRYQRGHR
ncbi:MAG: endolytic transglycosylase MltG [bacterium]|nr:endolytic transglycosylase MltG [bacterium]MCP5070110.1 endolytic transglycosylase MltG [bacterium]